MDNNEYLGKAVVAFISCTETVLLLCNLFGLFRFSVTFHCFRYLTTQVRILFLSTRVRQFLHSSKPNSKEFLILLNILFMFFDVSLFYNSKLSFLNFAPDAYLTIQMCNVPKKSGPKFME
jgi:hypothetical protein